MTKPDPGLTDLIAAALVRSSPNSIDTFDLLPYHRQEAWRVRAREVALMVEQHTNGRIAEVNARAKARVKAANKRASIRITQIRREEAARFEAEARVAKLEAERDVPSRLVIEDLRRALAVQDAALATAQATIARVWGVVNAYPNLRRPGVVRDILLALKGES